MEYVEYTGNALIEFDIVTFERDPVAFDSVLLNKLFTGGGGYADIYCILHYFHPPPPKLTSTRRIHHCLHSFYINLRFDKQGRIESIKFHMVDLRVYDGRFKSLRRSCLSPLGCRFLTTMTSSHRVLTMHDRVSMNRRVSINRRVSMYRRVSMNAEQLRSHRIRRPFSVFWC